MENAIIHFDEVETMESKREIYLKRIIDSPYGNQYKFKVTENSVVTITDNSIEIEDHDDFFDQVSFIKNTLCEDVVEISKDEFEGYFNQTMKVINESIAA